MMEITLEKIELVKDRTGVSYKEAKDALEASDGSVVDAIISIEETIDEKGGKKFGVKGDAIADKIKEIVQKGNVTKILVKRDEEVLLNLPVNAGIVGALVAPWGVVAGIVAAVGFKCVVEIVKADGTIIDVSDAARDTAGTVVEKSSGVVDAAKEKGGTAYNTVRSKAEEALNKVKKEKKEDDEIDFSNCFDQDSEDDRQV